MVAGYRRSLLSLLRSTWIRRGFVGCVIYIKVRGEIPLHMVEMPISRAYIIPRRVRRLDTHQPNHSYIHSGIKDNTRDLIWSRLLALFPYSLARLPLVANFQPELKLRRNGQLNRRVVILGELFRSYRKCIYDSQC